MAKRTSVKRKVPKGKKPAPKPMQVFRKNSNAIFRDSADGSTAILLLDDLMSFYRVDAWAADLWKRLDGKSTLEQIANKIQKASSLEAAFVQREASKTIAQLMKFGLVEKAV